ncbi:PilZ domain-containing protein [Pseudomonadota bacterium]
MEKRWTTRTPANLCVDLMYKDLEVVNCRTRDISLSGAYVEVQQLQPASDTPIDLVFKFGEIGSFTKYRVPAKVVRTDGEGVGIMFKDVDVSSFRSLREVLRHKDVELHP